MKIVSILCAKKRQIYLSKKNEKQSPTECKLEQDKILRIIKKYNSKALHTNLELKDFSSGTTSDASILFIICNSLPKAPATMINGRTNKKVEGN